MLKEEIKFLKGKINLLENDLLIFKKNELYEKPEFKKRIKRYQS